MDGGYLFGGMVMLMSMTEKSEERGCLLSVAEALGLMFIFGSFILAYTTFILDMAARNNDKKK